MMRPVPSVRVLAPSEWHCYRDLRLQALADSPDAFGSTLAAETERTDEEWAARLACGTGSGTDLPLIAEVSGLAAGLAWANVEPEDQTIAHLYQMWISPHYRGLGAGRMLLSTAIDWARSRGVRTMVLGVTCGNNPAARLYARVGFTPVGLPEPLRRGSELLEQTLRLGLIENAA